MGTNRLALAPADVVVRRLVKLGANVDTMSFVSYDDLLRLPLEGLRADIIGFADDVAFTFLGRTTEQVSALATANLERIER